jgi:hypothetical protein
MAFHRSAVAAVIATLLVLVVGGQAAHGLPRTPGPAVAQQRTAPAPVVLGSPCVHRGITFFCGHVPPYGRGPVITYLQFSFGNTADVPLFGDWDGDGDRTAAVFRPATATWYLTNEDDASDPPRQVRFGSPGDVPLAGDWDGTGTQTIGVYRPSNVTFYLRNSNTSGSADVAIPLGNPGDVPLAGDFDYTGTTRIGVYRPANATFYFTHGGRPVTTTTFGNRGDRPLAGNYWCPSLNSREDVFAVFRPSNITWYGLCESHAQGSTQVDFQYGEPGDLPLLK